MRFKCRCTGDSFELLEIVTKIKKSVYNNNFPENLDFSYEPYTYLQQQIAICRRCKKEWKAEYILDLEAKMKEDGVLIDDETDV